MSSIFLEASPETLIYSGDDGYVVVDGPCRPGHVLVATKSATPSLHETNEGELAAMMALARRVSLVIVEQTGAEKTYVVAIGDKDAHFHVHLIPKFKGEPSLGPAVFGSAGWAGLFLPEVVDQEQLEKVNERLRQALR